MFKFVISAAAVLFAAVVVHTQTPTAVDLAQRLQARYQTITSFTANFTTEFQTKLLPQVDRSSGTVKVLKPNRMWWKYEKPEKQDWVADGTVLWDYDATNRIVFRSEIPPATQQSTPLLFLAGRGDLVRDFTPSLAPNSPAGEWHLELRPKAGNADFQTLTLMVTRDDLRLVGMKIVDAKGTNTHRFTDLRENVKLTPADFAFKPPAGVRVEHR